MPQLSLKQQTFAKKYIEHDGNATQAALEAYNASYDSAQTIASRNLDKPAIIEEINRLLGELGVNDDAWIAKQMKTIVDNGVQAKTTAKDAVTVLNMLLKVKNSYPTNKSMQLKVSLKGKLTDENVSSVVETVKSLSVKSNELIKDLTS